MESVLDEIARRKERERAKALEKYGPRAVEPGGRPEFDILDFVINEVIGLERYGEMVRHRFAGRRSLELMGQTLEELSQTLSPALVLLRNKLLLEGNVLGTPEASRFELADNAHASRVLVPE